MGLLEERINKMLNKANSELLSSLKGRISKMFSFKSKLQKEEAMGLEGIYNAIDVFILSERDLVDTNELKEDLILYSKFLKDTKKDYIREHIIPLVNKISVRQWGGINE